MSERVRVAVSELCADAGRPDATEISRVVAVHFVRAVQGDGAAPQGAVDFSPTGSVPRTPGNALELAPGDPAGLASAGRAWALLARDADSGLSADLIDVAQDAAVAQLVLAERLLELQQRAEAVYVAADALGIDGATLGSRERMAALVASDPSAREHVAGPVEEMIAVRLDWVDATGAFIDGLKSARDLFGIADW